MNYSDKFQVVGGQKLSGSIRPSGNKNEALPVLAACMLTEGKINLENMPLIGDVLVMADIMRGLGVVITHDESDNHNWTVHAENVDADELDTSLFPKLRASITLVAPLLYRCGKAKMPIPGGDKIGKRRIDTHLLALQEMGVDVYEEENAYMLVCKNGLLAADILLDEASVTGTENIVMAAACARGTSTIYNAACEPHVQQLCHLLNSMGAKISGIGSNRLIIVGVPELGGTKHAIQSDYVEAGSFIGLAAATGSEITVENILRPPMRMIEKAYAKLGIELEWRGNNLHVSSKQSKRILSDYQGAISKLESATWPGLPADILSILLVAATQCEGTILVHEKLFESRLFFVDKLRGMGARIVLCDPHRAMVVGPAKLHAEHVTSPDIRAGVALLIAAMCAEGTSLIDNIYMIDRGYENLDLRLNAIGAKIERIK